jgi:hypothetical protein
MEPGSGTEPILEKDPAETLDYSVDFERHCARIREPNRDYALNVRVRPARPTGLQYVASVAGRSGANEPRWPTTVGGTVVDGSITWTAEVVSASSLIRTLSGASWTADTGVTVSTQTISGSVASCLLSSGKLGQSYLIRCDGTFSDGTVKTGAFYLALSRPRSIRL